mgnify:FL=1
MLAIAILAIISALAYLTFSGVTAAWKRGMALSDDLHHGDFVMEQLVMALRSAYYPDSKDKSGSCYGMITEDLGDGETGADTISWVKLGGALVGNDSHLAGNPHRVKVSMEDAPGGKRGLAVRAWRLQGQPDNFNADNLDFACLSSRVVGFNCRTAHEKRGDEMDWLDTWDETNRLPTVVELTVYMEPLDANESPVELKRVFSVPVAPLSWQ